MSLELETQRNKYRDKLKEAKREIKEIRKQLAEVRDELKSIAIELIGVSHLGRVEAIRTRIRKYLEENK